MTTQNERIMLSFCLEDGSDISTDNQKVIEDAFVPKLDSSFTAAGRKRGYIDPVQVIQHFSL